MRFVYKYALLPKDENLVSAVENAAEKLHKKMCCVHIDTLNISDYNKAYLAAKTKNLVYELQIYAFILCWALYDRAKPLKGLTFLDYGGGAGLLSVLAKETGIGTVIYNDIYGVSCRDAAVVGKALDVSADHYIRGDIGETVDFLRDHGLECDSIGSRDVIEHIYDVGEFLNKIPEVSSGDLTIVMTSDANIFNKKQVRALIKKQREAEYRDREPKYGHKERDTLKSYLSARKEIIASLGYDLKNDEIEKLAVLTRGMAREDIIKSVGLYLKEGRPIKGMRHPTNTCDPYTGNWCEHLMDIDQMMCTLSKKGFETRLLGGFYGYSWIQSRYPIKKSILDVFYAILDVLIRISGRWGLKLAPWFTVYAKRLK